jgi:hypothetical protein
MIAELDLSLVVSAAFQLASAVVSVGRVKTRSMSYRGASVLWRSAPSRTTRLYYRCALILSRSRGCAESAGIKVRKRRLVPIMAGAVHL